MSSTRTQIYLTRDQRRKLDARAKREAKTLAQVIREAVDDFLTTEPIDAATALTSTFGSLPDLDVPPRAEWNRGYG